MNNFRIPKGFPQVELEKMVNCCGLAKLAMWVMSRSRFRGSGLMDPLLLFRWFVEPCLQVNSASSAPISQDPLAFCREIN
ncbi:hypothetical protein JZ751_017167 [Albula glossodonta]|uniref:Uncharacterized protein n=1 Tax=Albula glossodonta TaxID=121402 RepID=A0A8T2P0L3_9TELE|nr:hypothetical protein JZ751_017167 [Albula glossodonta]